MDICTAPIPTSLKYANLMTLQFTVRQEQTLKMPSHTGSMLRGAFGVALRSLTCITDLPECKHCPLKQHCKFPLIFENPALNPSSVQAVNPYIIHVPMPKQSPATSTLYNNRTTSKRVSNIYNSGDIWHFGMTLMGSATVEQTLIIKAWQLALQTGLGAHTPYQRATLLSVSNADKTVYSSADHTQPTEAPILKEAQDLSNLLAIIKDTDALTLRFLTPFRYQQDNRIVSQPNKLDSATFIASLYNRIRLCQQNHSSDQSWNIGYDSYHMFKKDIESLDIEIDIIANHVPRRSNRQQRKMELYGLQGDIHLTGKPQTLKRLMPALLLGEYLHIGKNTTMGLGQYQLMVNPQV